MGKNKIILTAIIILLSLAVFVISNYINPQRDKLDFLSCRSHICPDHIIYGFGLSLFLYSLIIGIVFFAKSYLVKGKIRIRSIGEFRKDIFPYFFAIIPTIGFDFWWQFIKQPNNGSIEQFAYTLLGVILFGFYSKWFYNN